MLTEGDGTSSGLPLSSAFICFEDDSSAYVWAEKKGKLEKRSITLGEHDEATDTYDVLDGLTLEDYIAFPDEQLCHNGAPTTHEMTASENADMPMDNMGEGGMDMPMEDMPMEDMPMEDMPAEGMDMMPEESISGETGEMPGEDAAAAAPDDRFERFERVAGHVERPVEGGLHRPRLGDQGSRTLHVDPPVGGGVSTPKPTPSAPHSRAKRTSSSIWRNSVSE